MVCGSIGPVLHGARYDKRSLRDGLMTDLSCTKRAIASWRLRFSELCEGEHVCRSSVGKGSRWSSHVGYANNVSAKLEAEIDHKLEVAAIRRSVLDVKCDFDGGCHDGAGRPHHTGPQPEAL